ncbi:hypothetical protein SK128_021013 [Halocaridina rubra]|uniref:Uncharacterized protein n=1 Tax=Halocaridina rubra TaxID=373956 RepID=A0AAN9AF88_HALRR
MEGLNYLPEDMVVSVTDVTTTIFNTVVEAMQEAQAEAEEEKGRFFIPFFSGGCNDAFSVFGFLAFLLALLDLILEFGSEDTNRKRRETESHERYFPEDMFTTNRLRTNPDIVRASSACYSMYRGFLNALAATDHECAKRFLCEGAQEAASQGRLGSLIAAVASENAATLLRNTNITKYRDVVTGGLTGAGGGSCERAFSHCLTLPSVYRYPRVHMTDANEDFIPF